MKSNPLPLIVALLSFCVNCSAQDSSSYRLFLKSGAFIPEKNIDSISASQFNARRSKSQGQSLAIIQFEHIPTLLERQQLSNAGIELVDYIPNNAYTASISGLVNEKLLKQVRARAIVELDAAKKMPWILTTGIAPPWSVKIPGTVDVWVSLLKTLPYESILTELQQRNFDTLSTGFRNYHIISLRVALARVNELASLPFVVYVQPAPHEDQPLNNTDRANARANFLNAPLSMGGRNLKGQGMVIGIGDDSDPSLNIDFTTRVISRTYAPSTSSHGKHVAGTAAGAGIMNELYKGFAPKATIVTQYFSGIWINAPTYFHDYGMVITNNSYGAIVGDCSYNGLYDLYSAILDQEALDYPYLQNVFASGNSGLDVCAPYPAGFKTILGSYQSAKNVLTVGATDSAGLITGFSSKGPAKDGRLKPEIVTMGLRVISDGSTSYIYDSGTSMASPGASGGMTLLYQLYKQLNGGINPKSGLMKAVLCNSSLDKGNPGPDFSYGFGWMDLKRSAITIENNRFFTANVANAVQNTHSITVPANVAQLKVMLYWQDPPASPLSDRTLVNDLDLTVQTPSSTTVFPKILDTIPTHVGSASSEGPDHINNIEQVVINNPQAGGYSIHVNGNSITQNSPQEYYVTYDFVPDSTTLSFPIGGEAFNTNDSTLIQWDSYGNSSTFKLEYSTNNGTNWTTINNSLAGNLRQKKWLLPNVTTEQAKIKLTNNTTGATSTSNDFTILGVPVVKLVTPTCEGYIKINWVHIPGATDYEVFMVRGDDMQSMAVTTDTVFTFSGLSKDTVYWVAARARLNGNPGRRSPAVSRQPNTGTCAGNISDNDLKLDSIITALAGRKFTSSEFSNAVAIKARIKNLDNVAISGFDMSYSVNGGAWVTEHVVTAVSGAATYTHTFATSYDFSAIGSYTLKIAVHYPADSVHSNDTLTTLIRQLDNQPVDLTSKFTEDFDAATPLETRTAQVGLTSLDRFDFLNSSIRGRLRSFVNSGIAHSGSNAITLDVDRYILPSTNTNYFVGTFNLSNYNASTDDIRLDFFYNNHGQPSGAANEVWVRGTDSSAWVPIYDLFANQNVPGVYKQTPSIELSDLLAAAGQNFSPSSQIRWGQFGYLSAVDQQNAGGYSFDDINLYTAVDDIQLLSIDTPGINSCGLNSSTPVRISVRNSANTILSNVPVKLKIDGGPPVDDTIPSIAGNATTSFTFGSTANLATPGAHQVEAWVDYPTDSYRQNDTAQVDLTNSFIINSFPYLENFESGDGSWFTGGSRSSWEYGTPASTKINSAASGSRAWKTRLVGNYNDLEYSYLYSPCFDISGMTQPTLSLSIALDLEDCGASLCDGAWIEYSGDGKNWSRLGAFSSGTNWYNKNYAGSELWNVQNYTRWHVATNALPLGLTALRLRVVMHSDQAVNREGIAVDDIHIYDNTTGIYDGPTLVAPLNQVIAGGNAWIDFTSGGKLVASVQPNNQNMGSTNVQAYINSAAVRNFRKQYYHDRNITIIPANTLTDSAIVRFYFLDSEVEALLNATGCPACSKPASAYELGISKYTEPTNRGNEDGSLANDLAGTWSFISSSRATKVPFDKGYYAEFRVKDFSEFWLNNGGPSGLIPLPLDLVSFTAEKQTNNDVLVKWKTANEVNIDRFEIELARTSTDFQSGNFVRIGQVSSPGNSSLIQEYDFNDAENNKSGTRYYRLKMVSQNGSVQYSEVRPVIFQNDLNWQVYPNPSSGLFNLIFKQNPGEEINVKVYNVKGQLIQQSRTVATGFAQKVPVNLQQNRFGPGMYLIVAKGVELRNFKVVKQ